MTGGNGSSLEAMVREALDRAQIEEIFVRYYGGMGSGDPGGFGGFFTEDPYLDVNGMIATNKDEITELYRSVAEDKPNLTGQFRMILSNMFIEIDGDRAKAQMLWTQTLNESLKGPPRLIEQGREFDELVRVDGRWKIKRRVVIADSGMPDIMDETYTPRPDFQL
jgi:hypothetical protein